MGLHYNIMRVEQASFEDYQHIMRISTANGTLANTIIGNYEAYINNPKTSSNGQSSGTAFEVAVGDAICKFAGSHWRIVPHVRYKPRNAEVDLLLWSDTTAHLLFLKTSFRERWKQEDRDALLFTRDNNHPELHSILGIRFRYVIPWVLMYKERPEYSSLKAVENARQKAELHAGVHADNVLSVFDKHRMAVLAGAIE